jgi:hypothetical protein
MTVSTHIMQLARTAREEHDLGITDYAGIFDPALLEADAPADEIVAHAIAHRIALILGNNLDLSYDLEQVATTV